MSGLGERGKKKIPSAESLFKKTAAPCPEAGEPAGEESPPVKKNFAFSFEMAEKLRRFAFVMRRKEVDIVRDALAEYFAKHEIR